MGWINLRKKKLPEYGEVLREEMNKMKEARTIYYVDVIFSLIAGSSMQHMGVINLYPVEGVCGYYVYDDNVIVYYDDTIKALLEKDGISSYRGSNDRLVITTDKDRLINQRENSFPTTYE